MCGAFLGEPIFWVVGGLLLNFGLTYLRNKHFFSG